MGSDPGLSLQWGTGNTRNLQQLCLLIIVLSIVGFISALFYGCGDCVVFSIISFLWGFYGFWVAGRGDLFGLWFFMVGSCLLAILDFISICRALVTLGKCNDCGNVWWWLIVEICEFLVHLGCTYFSFVIRSRVLWPPQP